MVGQDLFRRTIRWLLVIVAIAFLIIGFGITEFRVVEATMLLSYIFLGSGGWIRTSDLQVMSSKLHLQRSPEQ